MSTFNFEGLEPLREIFDLKVWCLWKLEPGKNGKPAKMPYSAKTGTRARSNAPGTLCTYAEAKRAALSSPEQYQGVMLCVDGAQNIAGVDIDHCITDGVFSDLAERVLADFPDTYAELSQSGTGVHIVCRGHIPKNVNNRLHGIELYGSNTPHFIALTGNRFGGTELRFKQPELNALYKNFGAAKKTPKPSAPLRESLCTLSDDEILEKARKNEKFRLLFDSGDYTAAGYPSQSEADIALCGLLAYWTERNVEIIERLFNSSALAREKWTQREDYRRETIETACRNCAKTANEYMKEKTLEGFLDLSREDIIAPYADYILNKLRALSSEALKRIDGIALAQLFAETLKDRLKYNTTAREWFFYDGVRWAIDTEGMKAETFAKAFTRALQYYAVENDFPELNKSALKLLERNKRVQLLNDARDLMPCCAADFDRQPFYFNTLSCVLNLETGETLEHAPEYMLSMVAGAEYQAEAKAPLFERFFADIMNGDTEKGIYLQKLLGYSMTGINTRDELYIIYGASTRNGKSTLLETLAAVMGDYSKAIQPETLAQRDKNSRNASGDIARLAGCRFCRCSEPPKYMLLDASLVKSLTGKDKITARHLHEREFEFYPHFKLFINTNHLPTVTDDTVFESGRVVVIPFDRHFTEAEQDKALKEKLCTPENLAGILKWLLEGLRLFQADRNLRRPDSVREASEDYRKSSDKITGFFDECLIKNDASNLPGKAVYDFYFHWCGDAGHRAESKTRFFAELKRRGLLKDTGTVNGITVHNIVSGYAYAGDDYPEI